MTPLKENLERLESAINRLAAAPAARAATSN
jgi:hypothetical protein